MLLNFAQCKLSKKEYYPVIEHTTEVLESDPGKPVFDLKIQIKDHFFQKKNGPSGCGLHFVDKKLRVAF